MRTISRRTGAARTSSSPLRRGLAAALAGALALAGCGQSDTDAGPGGVTVGEARALDEAAEMLDQQRLPAEALPPPAETAESPEPDKIPQAKPAA
jgi:hypothetical protein